MPRKLLRRLMPNPHRIREHRWLGWLAPMLHHPRLWHVSRGGIALGAAIGLFFGLLVPIGQIPVSAAVAIVLRANLPMAVAGTFVTNPFTFAPLYYLAYRIGLLLTGVDAPPLIPTMSFDAHAADFSGWLMFWSERVLRLGKPLFIGLFVMASFSAVVSYFSINWLWRLLTLRAWRRRTTHRKLSGTKAV